MLTNQIANSCQFHQGLRCHASRVTRQTKEDPGDEVVMNADYYEDHCKGHKHKALITIPICFRFFKALAG